MLSQKVVIWYVKYEKLPHFCYRCGRLSHSMKDCEENKRDMDQMFIDSLYKEQL